MSGYVLLDLAKLEHAERIRRAERDRALAMARAAADRNDRRPSLLKSLLLALGRS